MGPLALRWDSGKDAYVGRRVSTDTLNANPQPYGGCNAGNPSLDRLRRASTVEHSLDRQDRETAIVSGNQPVVGVRRVGMHRSYGPSGLHFGRCGLADVQYGQRSAVHGSFRVGVALP